MDKVTNPPSMQQIKLFWFVIVLISPMLLAAQTYSSSCQKIPTGTGAAFVFTIPISRRITSLVRKIISTCPGILERISLAWAILLALSMGMRRLLSGGIIFSAAGCSRLPRVNVKPEIADQVSMGYYRCFRNNQYEFSSAVYYRDKQNQIDYK